MIKNLTLLLDFYMNVFYSLSDTFNLMYIVCIILQFSFDKVNFIIQLYAIN